MNLLTARCLGGSRWLGLVVLSWTLSLQAGAAEDVGAACWRNSNRVEFNHCLADALARLEQQQQQVFLRLEQQAAELEAISEGAKGLALALSQANEDFEHFTHSHCTWEMKMMASGSGAGSHYLLCKIKLTENRLSRLRQWLKPSD